MNSTGRQRKTLHGGRKLVRLWVVLALGGFASAETVEAAWDGANDASQAARTDREDEGDDDGEDGSFLAGWELGVETSVEFVRESGIEGSQELTFDEVGLALGRDRWGVNAGIKYEASNGVLVEEFAFRFAGAGARPWFVAGGRTSVPFGLFDSQFSGDPLVAILGETIENTFMFGVANEFVTVPIAFFRGNSTAEGDVEFAMTAKASPRENLTLGVSWSSALGESSELRQLREEAIEGAGPDEEEESSGPVDGIGLFAAVDFDRVLIQAEYIAAAGVFGEGVLGEEENHPRAMSMELAVRPTWSLMLAARVDASRELPEHPATQYGVAASYRLSEHVAVAVEFLRGTFEDAELDRDLVGTALTLEF